MAELPFEALPDIGTNRRTPTSIYQIDVLKIEAALALLQSGAGISDEAITTRTLSPEVLALVTLGFKGVVDDFDDLPAAGNAGDIWLAKTSITEHPQGFYKDSGVIWEWIASYVSASTDLTDMPSSLAGQAGRLARVKADETGYEFVDIYDRMMIKGTLAVADNVISWIAGRAGTISEVMVLAHDAAVGDDIIFDILLNGVTIFESQPVYAEGSEVVDTYADLLDSENIAVVIGDEFVVNIIQVGSTTPGGNALHFGVKY